MSLTAVARRPGVLLSSAGLVALSLVLTADASGSTPARWYAALAACLVFAAALVVASGHKPYLGLVVSVSVVAISALVLLAAALKATGVWGPPGERSWDEPIWGLIGGTVAVLAIGGGAAVAVRVRRNVLGAPAASALTLLFLVLAILGGYLVIGSMSFTQELLVE